MQMRVVGTGTFSKVYKKPKENKVFIVSNDPVKECMSLGWFPKSIHYPKVTRLDTTYSRPDDKQEFEMRFLKVCQSRKTLFKHLRQDQIIFYKNLETLFDSLCYFNKSNIYQSRMDFLKSRINDKKHLFTRTQRKILLDAIDALSNYGDDICFEIHPRNVAVSRKGTLILLDCFFMYYKLREVENANHETN